MTKQEFLAMSLPYGVKILWRDGEIVTLEPRIIRFIFDNNKYTKPILRSLYSLNKPIEHKGETFVPIYRLLDEIIKEWRACGLDYPNDSAEFHSQIITSINSCEFWIIKKLVEWHFDIADLISKGEAIDVNTLEENPYK